MISPFTNIKKDDINKKNLELIGLEIIKNNGLGIIILAGGEGTRLGLNVPKGMAEIGKGNNKKSLFQIHCEKIKKLISKINFFEENIHIPLYIMTSDKTNDTIVNYFKSNNFFGLDKNDVYFFKQDNTFCIDKDGNKILQNILDDGTKKYAKSPNGSGGLYLGLFKHNIINDMINRKLQYIYVCNIDNPLLKIGDPVIVGYMNNNKLDIASKIIKKTNPEEKTGVFCYKNNIPHVMEYFEMDTKEKNIRNNNGDLLYNASNIGIYCFSIIFLQKICLMNYSKYHLAHKKIPYYDELSKKTIKPIENNGYKQELFIFDVFKFCDKDKMGLLHTTRKEEFLPIKKMEDLIKANELFF